VGDDRNTLPAFDLFEYFLRSNTHLRFVIR
jgi:hypothetical protein